MVQDSALSSKKGAGMAMSQYVGIVIVVVMVIIVTLYIIRRVKESGL